MGYAFFATQRSFLSRLLIGNSLNVINCTVGPNRPLEDRKEHGDEVSREEPWSSPHVSWRHQARVAGCLIQKGGASWMLSIGILSLRMISFFRSIRRKPRLLPSAGKGPT